MVVRPGSSDTSGVMTRLRPVVTTVMCSLAELNIALLEKHRLAHRVKLTPGLPPSRLALRRVSP
jgi:hypothetical protein